MKRAAGAFLAFIASAGLPVAGANAGGPALDENCQPKGLVAWAEVRLNPDPFWRNQYAALSDAIEVDRLDYADSALEMQKIRATSRIEIRQAGIRAKAAGQDPQAAAIPEGEELRNESEVVAALGLAAQHHIDWAEGCRRWILQQVFGLEPLRSGSAAE